MWITLAGGSSGSIKIAWRGLWITCCAFVDPLPGPPPALPLGSDACSVDRERERERERGDIASRGDEREEGEEKEEGA